jgi:hypothetical protein
VSVDAEPPPLVPGDENTLSGNAIPGSHDSRAQPIVSSPILSTHQHNVFMQSDPTVHEAEDLRAATAAVRRYIEAAPEVALILGSGLGRLAEAARDTTTVPATAIPGYPESTVEGHNGRLVFGVLEETRVVFVQGRVHLYEGYPVQQITMPVRLVHALGARQMLVTNSAGGINRAFRPGALMFITSHLNMAFCVVLRPGLDTAGGAGGAGTRAGCASWHLCVDAGAELRDKGRGASAGPPRC